MWRFCVGLLLFVAQSLAKEKLTPISLEEDTWQAMLKDEWLVKFYAPWCPACQSLRPVWEQVAGWSQDLNIKVASVDVTTNPGLSGRFLVTALPTIYHVKDGVFRQYIGARTENDILSFVDDKKWQEVEPVAWYLSPTAIHMATLGQFFKLSVSIRDLHSSMTEYGIPVWGSYCIFALATIFAGLILGLIVVYLCDVIYPPSVPLTMPRAAQDPRTQQLAHDDVQEDDSDMIVDDRKITEVQPTDGTEGDEDNEEKSEDEAEDTDELLPSSEQSGGDVPDSLRKRAPKPASSE